MRRLPALFLVCHVVMIPALASGAPDPTEKSPRAYSCDNPAWRAKAAAKAPCFPPDDPMYMTIALFSEPVRGTKTRIPDPGDGVPIRVLEKKTVLGDEWFRVKTKDGKHTGWLLGQFVFEVP